MKHSFSPSPIDGMKCNICKRPIIDHMASAVCESCGVNGTCNINMANILLCPDCETKDKNVMTPAKIDILATIKERINGENKSITISTDIFNAEVLSIGEIIKQLNTDPEITNKNFALAQIIDARFKHLSGVIFEASKTKTEAENQQRAIQVTYNELSKKLRAEEREAIRLKDINYQPVQAPVSKPKVIKTKKFDKAAIRKASFDHGIPEAVLQMLCVSKDIPVDEAVKQARAVGLGN